MKYDTLSVALQFSDVSDVLLPSAWPVSAHSVAICDGLEDWGATDLSNISDSDEDDQPTPLVRICSCHGTGSAGEMNEHIPAINRPQQVSSDAGT